MRDPLEWRSGDGPLEEWLDRIEGLLVGRGPAGYTLWGRRTEEHVYGQVLGSGLSACEVARRLTALGADGVHVRTSAGFGHGGPRFELAPLGDFSRPDKAFEFVALDGVPAGPVPLRGTVRTPTELAAWLASWSLLLPGGVPGAGWSPRPFPEPMAVAFQHRADASQLLLTPAAAAERSGNVSIRMLLESTRADLGRHLLLLRTPRVLDRQRPGSHRELRAWLDRLAEVWRADPLPPLGDDGPVPLEPSFEIPRITHGAPEMLVHRLGLPMLLVSGPASDIGRWGPLLHDPAVLGAAEAGSRRKVAGWLDQVAAAVWGRPAAWTVQDGPGPLTGAELAAWIAGNRGRGELHLDRVGPAGTTLGGLETATGRRTITGR